MVVGVGKCVWRGLCVRGVCCVQASMGLQHYKETGDRIIVDQSLGPFKAHTPLLPRPPPPTLPARPGRLPGARAGGGDGAMGGAGR